MTKSYITEPLGLYGWTAMEPVLLAALITEEPLLLVGSHGCAKSFLLERLAESLQMQFRSYNASLLNYDDLVGIPMPNRTRSALHYISSPSSIWDAEVVFLDEINRTRLDLQNKLFPIIYDRRIQGQKLEKLRYRWAAMNPPFEQSEDPDADLDPYLGTLPLDPALADRFTFILSVPSWENLTDSDRSNLLQDTFGGRHNFEVDMPSLIAMGKKHYSNLIQDQTDFATSLVLVLTDRLRKEGYDISVRRSTMLLRAYLSIRAAQTALAELNQALEPDWAETLLLTLTSALPDRARKSIDNVSLKMLAQEVGKLFHTQDKVLVDLYKISNPVDRLHQLLREVEAYDDDTILQVVSDGVAFVPQPLRRVWALLSYLKLQDRPSVPASCMELLVKEIEPVLRPRLQPAPESGYQLPGYYRKLVSKANPYFHPDSMAANYIKNMLASFSYLNNRNAGKLARTMGKLIVELFDATDFVTILSDCPDDTKQDAEEAESDLDDFLKELGIDTTVF